MSPMPERMTDHWWWRPGVRSGRRLLVWHILLNDQPDVRALLHECQEKLAELPGLDLIPEEWLHMTTQIVGFADDISAAEIDTMTAAATKRLGLLRPIEVEIGTVLFHSEAVMLGIQPGRALDPVRIAIREAINETIAAHQLAEEPEWTPHVSVAYSNGDGPAAPIIEALDTRPQPKPLTVSQVHLVSQERDHRLYRWEPIATVPITG